MSRIFHHAARTTAKNDDAGQRRPAYKNLQAENAGWGDPTDAEPHVPSRVL